MPDARPSTAGSHAVASDSDLGTEWDSASEAGDGDVESGAPLLDAAPSLADDAPTSFSDAGGDDLPAPPPVPSNVEARLKAVTRLTLPAAPGAGVATSDFFVVGTAHVSRASCDDVAAAITALRPQVVLVELCSERSAMLRADAGKAEARSLSSALGDWRAGRVTLLMALYSWMLGQAGDALETAPGEEFRVAVSAAAAVGAKVVLGDRPVSITLARTWAALSPWHRCRFLFELLCTGFSVDADELKRLLADMEDGDAVTAAILEMGVSCAWEREGGRKGCRLTHARVRKTHPPLTHTDCLPHHPPPPPLRTGRLHGARVPRPEGQGCRAHGSGRGRRARWRHEEKLAR